MTFLEQVIEEKRQDVKRKKEEKSIEELKSMGLLYKKRPFFEVFKKRYPHEIKIIAEIKMASPSTGLISKDILPERQAMAYEAGGAHSISVITEHRHFKGKMEYVPLVKKAVNVAVLRKDFMVDVYDVYESKALGADAVLLIGEALEREIIRDCLMIAKEIGIDCVIEIHELSTFDKVADMNGFILGINNRDLKTLDVDISKGLELLQQIPLDIPVIIESGIEKREDILMFMEKGVSGFLVGTTLMRSENPMKKIMELRGMDGYKD
ncbi:MAG: indole-3-glycerol phosphate synthase TrpC [Syntrophorhabdaceae bacterium]|nr:indole-3-glycerol phosphate synthase TrpC [Syntrophorhabdaceae bacterium]